MDMDVKVFISWSGEPSRSIAHALRKWLPTVAQHVEPWMSVADIKGGHRWNDEVVAALDASGFGIVCLTASNQHEPWLTFEAGALAKRLHGERGRVVPLYIDLGPSDVTGPLGAFQGHELDEDGMGNLVRDLMELRPNPPDADGLFQAMWPQLKVQVYEAKQRSPAPEIPKRSERDMLEELVERVRRLEREEGEKSRSGLPPVSEVRLGDGSLPRKGMRIRIPDGRSGRLESVIPTPNLANAHDGIVKVIVDGTADTLQLGASSILQWNTGEG